MATRTRRNAGPLDAAMWKTHYEQLWKPMTPAQQVPATPHEGMTLVQFQAAREALRGALKPFETTQPTCVNCEKFSMGRCSEFGEVPKEFQETPEACGSWVFDAIPF